MATEFDDQINGRVTYNNLYNSSSQQQTSLIKLILKFGFTKDETTALYILIGIAVVAAVTTIYIFSTTVFHSGSVASSEKQDEIKQLMQPN